MNNQIPINQTTTEKKGGKFCTYCGEPLYENGMCHNPNCPAKLNANQQFSSAPQSQVNSQYQQQPAAPTIFNYALDYIKVFFSSKPFAAVENIAKTTENIWIALGGAAVALISLGLFGIGSQDIYEVNFAMFLTSICYLLSNNISDIDSAFTSNDITWLNDGFKLFVFLLLTVSFQFFATAGINCVMFSVNKKKVSFVTSLNVLSVSLLPMILAGVIAFVTSYINILATCLVIFAGLILSYIQLYFGIQKTVKFSKSPFWSFAAVVLADMASLFLITTVLSKIFG